MLEINWLPRNLYYSFYFKEYFLSCPGVILVSLNEVFKFSHCLYFSDNLCVFYLNTFWEHISVSSLTYYIFVHKKKSYKAFTALALLSTGC